MNTIGELIPEWDVEIKLFLRGRDFDDPVSSTLSSDNFQINVSTRDINVEIMPIAKVLRSKYHLGQLFLQGNLILNNLIRQQLSGELDVDWNFYDHGSGFAISGLVRRVTQLPTGGEIIQGQDNSKP